MNQAISMKLVGVALPTLAALRSAILQSQDAESAVNTLREAGYAGGEGVFDAFEQWLAETGQTSGSADMALKEFGDRVEEFLRNSGWGDVAFSHDESEGIAMIDIDRCWEMSNGNEGEGCHVTTGMLAGFFGRVAGYPMSVMETECCEGGRCKFVLGNADVMQYRWEALS